MFKILAYLDLKNTEQALRKMNAERFSAAKESVGIRPLFAVRAL